jgi:CheY-like chemotaxis protein
MSSLKNIILAEDNPKDVELTLEALSELNLANDVVVLNDGAQVLDYLYCRAKYANRPPIRPAVVLLDLKMPKINGLEVLSTLKGDPELKGIPVVVLTSSREAPDLAESYRLGVNAYVVKPVEFAAFVMAVKQVGAFWAILNELPPGSVKKPAGNAG